MKTSIKVGIEVDRLFSIDSESYKIQSISSKIVTYAFQYLRPRAMRYMPKTEHDHETDV